MHDTVKCCLVPCHKLNIRFYLPCIRKINTNLNIRFNPLHQDDVYVNFPLIFKLGLIVHSKSLLITTHEYLLQYAAEYKTEK